MMGLGSGGGVSMDVVVGLGAMHPLGHGRGEPPTGFHVVVARLGRVNEDYFTAIAAAVDAAAALVPGAVCCTLAATPRIDDHMQSAPVALELLANVNAARDALVETVAPFAPELDKTAAWMPMAEWSSQPTPAASSAWIAEELQLLAVINGPLGRHTRVLHASALGARATIAR